jgi:purine-nucleoside phosphorylase
MLGSGLGEVAAGYETMAAVAFDAVPGLSRTEVPGHAGEIRLCHVGPTPCLFIRGRKHLYEGRTGEITSLVSYIASAGVEELVVMSAAGSLLSTLRPGEFVLVQRILDVQHRRPAPASRAPGFSRPGSRPLELDPALSERLERAAMACGVALVRGTLASCAGPTFETPAEVYALQQAGAAVASMSAAPEVATAASLGIRVACLGLVTNWVTGLSRGRLDHQHVLDAGRPATGALRRVLSQFVVTT